jgi:hypothetical protein
MSENEVFDVLSVNARKRCRLVWRLRHNLSLLPAEDLRLAKAMMGHPEWAPLWEFEGDDASSTLTADGVDPYAAVAIEAATESLKSADACTIRVFSKLRLSGYSKEQANTMIAQCLAAVLWEVQTGRIEPSCGQARFEEVLERLHEGELPSDIWPDD